MKSIISELVRLSMVEASPQSATRVKPEPKEPDHELTPSERLEWLKEKGIRGEFIEFMPDTDFARKPERPRDEQAFLKELRGSRPSPKPAEREIVAGVALRKPPSPFPWRERKQHFIDEVATLLVLTRKAINKHNRRRGHR